MNIPDGYIRCPRCANAYGRVHCPRCGLALTMEQVRVKVSSGGEPDAAPRKAILKRGRKLNKTEQRFAEERPDGAEEGELIAQKIVLSLGQEDTYRPDFVRVPTRADCNAKRCCLEVKGGHLGRVAWSREGIQKFRRARETWGDVFYFELWVWRGRAGGWVEER